MSFYLVLYRWFLYPLARFLFHFAALLHPKIASGLQLRKKQNGRFPWLLGEAKTSPIWIHCASGEFEYAKPVLREIKEQWPEQKTLVTYFSPSVQKSVEDHPDVDFATPSPWDTPNCLNNFLNHHTPRCLLIARTDIWPEQLLACKKRSIPTLLFSATLVSQSGRMSNFVRGFYRWSMSLLSEIYCVTEDDVEVFKKLGVSTKISSQGDTRYDQVLARLDKAKNEIQTPKNSLVFVAGSTWPEDEEVLFKAWKKLKEQKAKISFIIAPHEPTPSHIKDLIAKAEAAGLSYQLSTKDKNLHTDLLIIDQVGILAEAYLSGDIAFVGGSFRKTVHSVMEPLAAGCLTLVGPLHVNNREAIGFQKVPLSDNLSAVICTNDETEILETISYYRNMDSEIKSKIKNEIVARSGNSKIVLDWIAKRDQ